MSLNFLPGRPNNTIQTACQASWQNQVILAYCSGNNLILLSNSYARLQTIYIDSDCVAVDIDGNNGFIALAYSNKVNIYKPIHQVMKNPKWTLCCEIMHDESRVNCIKWGSQGEIIIGSNYLSFWKIIDEYGVYKSVLLWNKRQPKPVYMCTISNDSQFVASVGKYDKTVKFWTRKIISGEQVLFSLSLLPHTGYVTFLKWKVACNDGAHSNDSNSIYSKNESSKSISGRSNISNFEDTTLTQTLYTLCSDKKLRIWSCHDINKEKTVQQWGVVQLKDTQRFAFIIDNCVLNNIVKEEFLIKYGIHTIPDLVFLTSKDGQCEVIALENLSQNPPRPINQKVLFNKQISESLYLTNPEYINFCEAQICNNKENKNSVSLVLHDMNGFIQHITIDINTLLMEHSKENIKDNFTFTGHNKSIQKLVRSSDGEAMLTLSRFSENCVWCPLGLSNGSSLWLKNIIITETPVAHAIIHEKGNLVIVLLENHKIQAWHCLSSHVNTELEKAEIIAEYDLATSQDEFGEIVLMLNTPEKKHNYGRHFIALIYNSGKTRSFEVSSEGSIVEGTSNSLDVSGLKIQNISIIDPVHMTFVSDRPLISLISDSGVTRTYKAVVESTQKNVEWKIDAEINTGIQNARNVRGSSTGKLCIVDSSGKRFSLWDLNRRVLEYDEQFTECIKDVDWTSTKFGQSIVSIGFTGYVLLYTQLRYDYTNNIPSYLPIEKIDITEHTAHDIGDSIWLKDGTFVVGSGNQLYIKDKSLDMHDPFVSRSIGSRMILSNDILHLNSVLNGPLPVYHPQFLIQSIILGKQKLVEELILRLFLEMRNINLKDLEISELPSNLNISSSAFILKFDKDFMPIQFPDPYPFFSGKVVEALVELLTKTSLPYLTRHQQMTLITVIEATLELSKNKNILDYNGLIFLLGVRLFHSHRATQRELSMRDVSWALHSDNKELLLKNLEDHIESWQNARDHKIAFWAKQNDLIVKIEQIAKFEFSNGSIRDPSKCAIYYLSLKKKQVLISLWKLSVGHPEQQKMLKFLNHDFTEARWKTAALKNAFALLSKHRFMDAACFFLLADSLKDTINVLFKQVADVDLAIAVCRLYEGDNGPILGDFLLRLFLPEAIMHDDRWMTSFIYWKLRKPEIAIKALVTAPIDIENNHLLVQKEKCVNKSFLVEDPALIILYQHLRKRNIKYFFGAQEIENKIEFSLILRVCNIYNRMGCDYLALSLVKNWTFIMPTDEVKKRTNSKSSSSKFGINDLTAEPSTTTRMRPSLFDKFDENTVSSHPSHHSKVSSEQPKSILDVFAEPAQKSSTPPASRSILESFSSEPVATKTNNILDSFSSSVSVQGQDGNDNKNLKENISNKVNLGSNEQPKNLLDDFGIPECSTKKLEPRNLLDDFGTDLDFNKRFIPQANQPSKPKNLLDDFM